MFYFVILILKKSLLTCVCVGSECRDRVGAILISKCVCSTLRGSCASNVVFFMQGGVGGCSDGRVGCLLNRRVEESISSFSVPHVELFLGETLNPNLLSVCACSSF